MKVSLIGAQNELVRSFNGLVDEIKSVSPDIKDEMYYVIERASELRLIVCVFASMIDEETGECCKMDIDSLEEEEE